MTYGKYKSPVHKVIKVLEESRDGWEEKAKDRAIEIRDLKKTIRDMEESRSAWKTKAKAALETLAVEKKELQDTREALTNSEKLLSEAQQKYEELKKKSQ